MQTQQLNRGDGGGGGRHRASAFNRGNEGWHLTVSAIEHNETIDKGRSTDAVMDYGKEVAWQRRQRLHSTTAAVAED